jgi:hypothetical protein
MYTIPSLNKAMRLLGVRSGFGITFPKAESDRVDARLALHRDCNCNSSRRGLIGRKARSWWRCWSEPPLTLAPSGRYRTPVS